MHPHVCRQHRGHMGMGGRGGAGPLHRWLCTNLAGVRVRVTQGVGTIPSFKQDMSVVWFWGLGGLIRVGPLTTALLASAPASRATLGHPPAIRLPSWILSLCLPPPLPCPSPPLPCPSPPPFRTAMNRGNSLVVGPVQLPCNFNSSAYRWGRGVDVGWV